MWLKSTSKFNSSPLSGKLYYNGQEVNLLKVSRVHRRPRTTDKCNNFLNYGNYTRNVYVNEYTLSFTGSSASYVTAIRTGSAYAGFSGGSLSNGATVAYGDSLYIYATQQASNAYVIGLKVNSVDKGTNTNMTVNNAVSIATYTGAYKSGTISVSNANCPHITPSIVRTSSPYGASIGTILNGATIYWGDVIRIDNIYTAGYTGGTVSPNPRTYKPTNNGDALSITMGAETRVTAVSLSWSAGTNTSISVFRTGSPNGHASTNVYLANGSAVYSGDTLTISRTYENSASAGGAITVNGTTYSASTSSVSFTVGAANVSISTAAATVQYTYSIYNNSGYTVSMDGTSVSSGSSRTWSTTSSYITITCTYAESTGLSGTAGSTVSKTLQKSTHSITRTKNNTSNYEKSYSITVSRNYCSSTSSYWYISSNPSIGLASISNSNYYTATLTLPAHSKATVKHDNIRYLFFS